MCCAILYYTILCYTITITITRYDLTATVGVSRLEVAARARPSKSYRTH